MWYHLNGLAQIVTVALAVDDCLVDAPCCYRVVSCCAYACESLIMSQVQIGLETVLCHVALTVFVRIQCTRINIDIGVELLNGDFVAACLQQLTNAGGNNAFSQRGNDAACNEDVLCIHKNIFYGLQNYDELGK